MDSATAMLETYRYTHLGDDLLAPFSGHTAVEPHIRYSTFFQALGDFVKKAGVDIEPPSAYNKPVSLPGKLRENERFLGKRRKIQELYQLIDFC